jgi:hypothetical protein
MKIITTVLMLLMVSLLSFGQLVRNATIQINAVSIP